MLDGLFKHKNDANVRTMHVGLAMLRDTIEGNTINRAFDLLQSIQHKPGCGLAKFLFSAVSASAIQQGSFREDLAELVKTEHSLKAYKLLRHLHGSGYIQDNVDTLQQRFHKLGDPFCSTYEAIDLWNGGQKQLALDIVVAAAYQDEPEAYYQLGNVFRVGDADLEIPKDFAKAKFFYLKAVKMGSRNAYHQVTGHESDFSLRTIFHFEFVNLVHCKIYSDAMLTTNSPCMQEIYRNPRLAFYAGKYLERQKTTDFSKGCAKEAVYRIQLSYSAHIQRLRASIFTFVLCCRLAGLRLIFDANVRTKIARLIWNDRKTLEITGP